MEYGLVIMTCSIARLVSHVAFSVLHVCNLHLLFWSHVIILFHLSIHLLCIHLLSHSTICHGSIGCYKITCDSMVINEISYKSHLYYLWWSTKQGSEFGLNPNKKSNIHIMYNMECSNVSRLWFKRTKHAADNITHMISLFTTAMEASHTSVPRLMTATKGPFLNNTCMLC